MIELVKFSMPNCGPCKVLQITLDHLMKKYGDKVIFTYVDASKDLDRAQQLQVRKAPTVIIFKDGVEQHRFEGAKDRLSAYTKVLNELLGVVMFFDMHNDWFFQDEDGYVHGPFVSKYEAELAYSRIYSYERPS